MGKKGVPTTTHSGCDCHGWQLRRSLLTQEAVCRTAIHQSFPLVGSRAGCAEEPLLPNKGTS